MGGDVPSFLAAKSWCLKGCSTQVDSKREGDIPPMTVNPWLLLLHHVLPPARGQNWPVKPLLGDLYSHLSDQSPAVIHMLHCLPSCHSVL